MGTVQHLKKQVYIAATLGLGALCTNLFIEFVCGFDAPLGNSLIFLATISLGFFGAIISVATGVLPQMLIQADYLEGARMILLCGIAGYVTHKHPRLSGAAIVGLVWIFALIPVLLILKGVVGSTSWTAELILLNLSADIVMSSMAVLAFMHPAIWSHLVLEPRQSNSFSLIAHVFCVVGLGAFLLALTLPNGAVTPASINLFYNGAFLSLAFIVLTIICSSVFFAQYVVEHLENGDGPILKGNTVGKFAAPLSQSLRVNNSHSHDTPIEPEASGWLSSKEHSSIHQSNDGSGLLVVHKSGLIMFVNKNFCDLFDIDGESYLDKKLSEVELANEMQEFINEVVEANDEGLPHGIEIKVNQLPDSLRFFEVNVLPGNADNSPWGDFGEEALVFHIKDITDRRTVESHLLQAQKLSSLGVAVGGLAHAFNNALTTISGQASFALRSKKPSLVENALESIVEASKRASELVWTLLEFSEGKPDLMEKKDLVQIIDERIGLLSKLVGETQELVLDCSEESIGVVCDPNLLTQALANLVINSKDAYEGRSGEIRIKIDTEEIFPETAHLMPGSRPGEFARIQVSDAGAGMTQEVLSKAFEPLFTTKQVTGSSGLGLSIVYAVLRAHDGFLTAESHPEKGTTISLYIPSVSLESDSPISGTHHNTNDESLLSPGNNESVLVVEDEDSVREMVSKMLETLGYNVRSACSPEQAMEICEYRRFDLLLVDMMMPKMDGIELLQQLKQTQREAGTLIMTGYGASASRAEGEVLTKPFDMDTLAKSVKQALC